MSDARAVLVSGATGLVGRRLVPALLAECVAAPEGEKALTEMDWRQAAVEGQLTAGELDLLFATAVNLNARQPDVSVGKGSTQTGS